MIVLIVVATLAAATPAPVQHDRTCVPMDVMLSFGSKAPPNAGAGACRIFPADQRVLDAADVDAGYIEPFWDAMD